MAERQRPDIEDELYKAWVNESTAWMAEHNMQVSSILEEDKPSVLVNYVNPSNGTIIPLLSYERLEKDVFIDRSVFRELTSGVEGVEIHPFVKIGMLQKKRAIVREIRLNRDLLRSLGSGEVGWAVAFAETEYAAIRTGEFYGLKVNFLETYYDLIKSGSLENLDNE